MGLREQFNEQMKEAMKAKDTKRLSTLRLMLRRAEGPRYRRAHRDQPRASGR